MDGNVSLSVSGCLSDSDDVPNSDSDSDSSIYATDDEIDPTVPPADLSLRNHSTGTTCLEVKKGSKFDKASNLPLVSVLNARSLYNKKSNFKTFVTELGIELAIVSETWERENESLETLLQIESHRVISYKRPKVKASKQPGGGCALIFNESRFNVSQLLVPVTSGVEAVWSLVQPKDEKAQVRKIAVCALYVSPNSKFKTKTIDHIVETIHLLRSQHGNEISFLLAGDLNMLDINPILQSYGALSQIVTEATRKSAVLEYIITDLLGLYHPPSCISPLEVDEDKIGKHSDHNIVVLAPINQPYTGPKRKKKIIKTRPLPPLMNGLKYIPAMM